MYALLNLIQHKFLCQPIGETLLENSSDSVPPAKLIRRRNMCPHFPETTNYITQFVIACSKPILNAEKDQVTGSMTRTVL